MLQINSQTYNKWKTEIIQNLHSSQYDQNYFSPIFDFISDIKSTNSLRKPLTNFTDDFIRIFLPSVISTILNTQSAKQSVDSCYSKLLKSISSLLPYLICSDYNEFIDTSITIILNQKYPFYLRSFSHYHSIIKTMATPMFLQQIQAYFKDCEVPNTLTSSFSSENLASIKTSLTSSVSLTSILSSTEVQLKNQQISLDRIYIIFMFLIIFNKYLDNRGVKDFLQTSFTIIKKMVNADSDKDLRLVQEKKINKIIKNFLSICTDSSLSQLMTKLYIDFNIRLIKSGFLSKQYSGLKSIREQIMKNNKNLSSYIYTRLKKENIIDDLLKNIHHELIKDFTIILREMIKDQAIEPYQIKQLWLTSIHQHQGTIDIFFSAISNLSMSFTSKQTAILFDAIMETNNFPDAALNFLGKKNLKFNPTQVFALFNKFSDLYFENSNNNSNNSTNNANNRSPKKLNNINNRSNILSTLSKFIPADKKIRMTIQDKCLHFIEVQENVEYSIAILKEILVGISEESARTYFSSIINMPSIKNVEFLDLIQKVMKSINGQITDEEFTKLHSLITDNFFDNYQSEVAKFWMQMINDKHLRTKMMLTIFKNITSKPLNQNLHTFTHFLFIKMNTSRVLNDNLDNTNINNNDLVLKSLHKCKGLDEIWSLLYRENDTSNIFIKSLINLYVNSHEKDRYLNFIDHCKSNLRSPSVLKALTILIHDVEDGINKELFAIYPNKFLCDEDYYTINITGECEMSIRVLKYISANSLFVLISYILNESKRSLTFSVNDQIFTKSDVVKDNMTICVRSTKVSPVRPPLVNPSNLPSMILYDSSLCKEIFEIMNENKPNISPFAYELLTVLPTIKEEANLAMSEDPDWDSFLQLEKPFLFLYRSNIIGNRINSRNSEWYDRFMKTKGCSKFINLVLKISPQIPTEKLLILMRISCLIIHQSRFESHLNSFLSDFQSGSVDRLISVIGKCNDSALTSTCLKFLAKICPYQEPTIERNKELLMIVKSTFFHKESQIRISMRDIILKLPLKIQSEVTMSLLPLSATSRRCAEFFTMIKEMAKVTNNVELMWDKLVEIFFKKFECSNSNDPISKLEFEAPTSPFVNGIITVLIELTKRIDTMTYVSDLFWFLIDKIILNDYKYYEITPNYYVLLTLLIQKEPKLSIEFIDKMNSFKFSSSKSIPSCKLLTYDAEKGLRNLGATCYMNSMLQQFFHITEFRDLILSTHIPHHVNKKEPNNKEIINTTNNNNNNSTPTDNSESTSTNITNEVTDSNIGNNDLSTSESIELSKDLSTEIIITKSSSKFSNDDENKWLFELQKVFAKLIYFPASYIDTSSFVKSWKDWDGQPINPRQQQDAVEFLNMLLDRIEERIPNSSALFKGEIVHSVVGLSQEYSCESVETFVTFPLEVKDNPSVKDSLVTFLSPDRFDGQNQYNAEGIGKIDAEIYSRIRKAPQVLIIQLKRFEYNLQTNAREKLNNRYTFYQELDFSQVMENPGEFVNYVLVGVTVHTGGAMGGHYISHVHTEYGWLTFDDDTVTPIQEQEVLNSSYGGYSIIENWDEKGKRYVTTKVPKNKNAYLLFYKRVMMSQRDESSIFNFQNINDNMLIIDHSVLTSLLKDTKEVLNANILTSLNFNEFLLNSFNFNSNQSVFLYKFFVFNLRNQHKSNNNIFKVLANKIIEINSQPFANFLCDDNRKDDIIDFLILENSKELRKLYLSIFQRAVPHASDEKKDSLMKFVLDEILNHGDFLMKNWENFDEFFRILIILINRNTETWPSILFTFLLTAVYEYIDSWPKKKMIILRNIDLSAIFEILNIVVKKKNLYDNFKAQVTDSNFLLSFILSKMHCSPFIEFILSFKIKPEQVFQKVGGKIEATAAASFFVTSLQFNGNANYVINYVKKKDETFIKNFFDSLTERVLHFEFSNKNYLVSLKPLINHLFTSKEKALRVSILEFLEAAQIDNDEMYNFLMNQFNNIISLTNLISYDNNSKNLTQQQLQSVIPTREYFEILEKTIIIGGFQNRVIKNAKLFVDAIKEFSHMIFIPNLPIINLMEFLMETVGNENSQSFFKVASFGVFINSMNIMNTTNDYSFLRNFLEFVPMSESDSLFKHGVYTNLIQIMFNPTNRNTGILLMNQILLRTNQNNFKVSFSALCNYDIFSRIVNENGIFYFKTCWKLIMKCSTFPGFKSSVFPSSIVDGCLEIVEKFITETKSSNNNELAPFAAKLIAIYCKYYISGNKGKKSIFSSDPIEKIGKKLNNLKISYLVSVAKNEPKFCTFLASISSINSNISKKLFELIENDHNGYLKKVSTRTMKNASKMISAACSTFASNNAYLSRIKKIVLRELIFATRSETAEPLCEVVSKLLITKTVKIKELLSIISKVMNDTKDPLLFGGGFGGLLIEAIKIDQNFALFCTEKASLLLQELIISNTDQNNKEKIIIIIDFLSQMRSLFNINILALSLHENETELMELKKIEMKNHENAFDALYRLQLLK